MKRLAIFLSAMVAAVLFFTSCEGNIPVKDKSLYGKWEMYANDFPLPGMSGVPIAVDSIDTYLVFNKDMTFAFTSTYENLTGRYWVYNNATIKVMGGSDSNSSGGSFKEKHDFIKLQMPNGFVDWYFYEFSVDGDLILSSPPGYAGFVEYYRKVK